MRCSSRLRPPGTRRPRAALRLLGAHWLGAGGRSRQPAERRVGRGRPAEQPTHADPRRERLQDPASAIHRHPVLQGPLLQSWILRGDASRYSLHLVEFKIYYDCFVFK